MEQHSLELYSQVLNVELGPGDITEYEVDSLQLQPDTSHTNIEQKVVVKPPLRIPECHSQYSITGKKLLVNSDSSSEGCSKEKNVESEPNFGTTESDMPASNSPTSYHEVNRAEKRVNKCDNRNNPANLMDITENESQGDTMDLFQCGICQKKFHSLSNFFRHFHFHSEILIKPPDIHLCKNMHVSKGEVNCDNMATLCKNGEDNENKMAETPDTDDKELLSNRDSQEKTGLRCMACSQIFPSLCLLHDHIQARKSDMSYFFDAKTNCCIPQQMACCFASDSTVTFSVHFHDREGEVETCFEENKGLDENCEYHKVKSEEDCATQIVSDNGMEGNEMSADIVEGKERTRLKERVSTRTSSNDVCINNYERMLHQNTNQKQGQRIESKQKQNGRRKTKGTVSVPDKQCNYTDIPVKRKRGRPRKYVENLVKVESNEIKVHIIESSGTVAETPVENDEFNVKNSAESEEVGELPSVDIETKSVQIEDVTKKENVGFAGVSKTSKRGRPRKQDHELKHPRKIKLAQEKEKGTVKKEHITKMNKSERMLCTYCGKSILRYCMKNHVKACTMDRPYKCDTCPAQFATKGSLIGHQKAVHLKENPYQCEVCGDRFFVPSKLAKHKRTHTGERNFACSICDKRFMHIEYLRRHEKLHTGVKDQICSTCGKMFYSNWNLKQHELTHREIGAYQCSTCSKTFTTKRSLKKHQEAGCPSTRLNTQESKGMLGTSGNEVSTSVYSIVDVKVLSEPYISMSQQFT